MTLGSDQGPPPAAPAPRDPPPKLLHLHFDGRLTASLGQRLILLNVAGPIAPTPRWGWGGLGRLKLDLVEKGFPGPPPPEPAPAPGEGEERPKLR